LQTDNEALKEQLSVERSALAAAEARAQSEADKAGQAIAAFASLAERLDALAQSSDLWRARPWWPRLVG
jgi:hypothetical protein